MKEKIQILGNKLLVRELKEETKRGSVILVREEDLGYMKCEVVAVGDPLEDDKGFDLMSWMEVGSIVYVRSHAGLEMKFDEELILVGIMDVFGVLTVEVGE